MNNTESTSRGRRPALLAVAAVAVHPQGDIARLVPYLLAGGGVWVLFAAIIGGRRAAAITASTLASSGLLTVAVYAFFFTLRSRCFWTWTARPTALSAWCWRRPPGR